MTKNCFKLEYKICLENHFQWLKSTRYIELIVCMICCDILSCISFTRWSFERFHLYEMSFVHKINELWDSNFKIQDRIDFCSRFTIFISVENSSIILLLIFLFSIIIQNSKSISRSYELSFQQWFQRVCYIYWIDYACDVHLYL